MRAVFGKGWSLQGQAILKENFFQKKKKIDNVIKKTTNECVTQAIFSTI
jgi:hypothetical protein